MKKLTILLATFLTVNCFGLVAKESKTETFKNYAKPLGKLAVGLGMIGFDIASYSYQPEWIEKQSAISKYIESFSNIFNSKEPEEKARGTVTLFNALGAGILIKQGISELAALNEKPKQETPANTPQTVTEKIKDLVSTIFDKKTK